MATRAARSLRHEYGLYIEQEIENYKESIPRAAILAIGDEAAARLASESQFVLTELLLLEEVDRIIFKRLRLPMYDTWRRKRMKLHDEMRRPEHWGLHADDAVVRTIAAAHASSSHVLLAGGAERSALFLAANGCEVTTIGDEYEAVERVMRAALQAGLGERVHALTDELTQYHPSSPLHAVVCSHPTLDALAPADRARVIEVLQSATRDGGVHLVETIVAGSAAIEELRSRYAGWTISIEADRSDTQVFFARKDRERAVSH